jgi:heat shock protein HtpX
MFHPLPAQTVFEAKARTRRATRRLFILLILLYVGFFNLMLIAAFLGSGEMRPTQLFTYVPRIAWVGTGVSVLLAVLHFLSARSKRLPDMLERLGTRPADPKDRVHKVFLNLVEEAEAATGIRPIQAVVLPTPGCNAFSLQDGKGACAIGATEGILTKLDRQELAAVVAHEAAHLVHGDSRLVATACFLFGVFARINRFLGEIMSRTSSRGRGKGGGAFLLVWIISGVALLVTKLVSMAISREREHYADADAVAMCKDPLSLADGLTKIAGRYRGDAPAEMGSLFILNPDLNGLDEGTGWLNGLFSTHPPVAERVGRLMAWAKTRVGDQKLREKKAETTAPAAGATPAPSFLLHQGDQWTGPFSPLQLLAMGTGPGHWVCREGDEAVSKASDVPDLLPLFEEKVQGTRSKGHCPRCKVPLLALDYEGAAVENCQFCSGYLLPRGVLERIVTREEKAFTEEEKQKASSWKKVPGQKFAQLDTTPEAVCPRCGGRMAKQIHSAITRVMLDRCTDVCGSVWCDGGELETIQILMEEARGSNG